MALKHCPNCGESLLPYMMTIEFIKKEAEARQPAEKTAPTPHSEAPRHLPSKRGRPRTKVTEDMLSKASELFAAMKTVSDVALEMKIPYRTSTYLRKLLISQGKLSAS